MFKINFAYDGIRTADLCGQKQLLCEMNHNHFPLSQNLAQSRFMVADPRVILWLEIVKVAANWKSLGG